MRPARPGPSLSVTLRVPFYDVDPMQVAWHGNYFKYFEAARDALLESRGIFLTKIYADTSYLFPVIRSSAKYIRPLRYGEIFVCTARITAAKRKIVTQYDIRVSPEDSPRATGVTEQVALRMPGQEMEYEIPGSIREALEI